jgi:hypothetical protein
MEIPVELNGWAPKPCEGKMDFAAHYRININPVGLAGHQATTYTAKVNEHLTWIHRTKTGKILLDCIRFHGRSVEIRPFPMAGCNSSGGFETPPAAPMRGFVQYSPDTFSLHGACPATTTVPNRGLFWDEILHHELVHVFRGVSGKYNKVALSGALLRYDDTEEFLAVMITNIYISDRSNRIKSGLRADHGGWSPLQLDLGAPFGFFASSSQVLPLIKQFVSDNHGLAIMLAHVDAPFNPIADYIASPDRAEQASRKALLRDLGGITFEAAKWAANLFH